MVTVACVVEVWSVCVWHWQPGSWVSVMEHNQNRLSWARWERGWGPHPNCCVCFWINRLSFSFSVSETVEYIPADWLFYSLLAPGRLPQVESAPVSSAKSKGHSYKPELKREQSRGLLEQQRSTPFYEQSAACWGASHTSEQRKHGHPDYTNANILSDNVWNYRGCL